MKSVHSLWFVMFVCAFSGCFAFEEEEVSTLSFWTDRAYKKGESISLLVNGENLGELSQDLKEVDCSTPGLLDYHMNKSEDLNLSVIDSKNDTVDLGTVDLYSVAKGISIKPRKDAEIFVNRSLDDVCTLVYLNWK